MGSLASTPIARPVAAYLISSAAFEWCFSNFVGSQQLVAYAIGGGVILVYSIWGDGRLGEPIYWWIAPAIGLCAVFVATVVIASLWNVIAVPSHIAADDEKEISRLTGDVAKLQVFDSVQDRISKLRTEPDGVKMFLLCASDLSAAGLCPQTLNWSFYGSVDWKVLLQFLGRLKILGFVESKTHMHTFNKGMDTAQIREATVPVETFYLNPDGSAALRIIERDS